MHQDKEKGIVLKLLTVNKKVPFPMTTIAELSETMQALLTTTANELAKKAGLSSDNGK